MDTFENHQFFNRHQSIEGFRINTSGTKPSLYITEVKLKKAVGELSHMDIEDIFEDEMTEVGVAFHRDKLLARINGLHDWQLLAALDILITVGRIEAITYVKNCKRTDVQPN